MSRVFMIVTVVLALVGGSAAMYHEFAPPAGGLLRGGAIVYVLGYVEMGLDHFDEGTACYETHLVYVRSAAEKPISENREIYGAVDALGPPDSSFAGIRLTEWPQHPASPYREHAEIPPLPSCDSLRLQKLLPKR